MFLDFVKCHSTEESGSQNLVHYFSNKEQRVSYICVDFFGIVNSSNTTVFGGINTAGVWDRCVRGAEVHPIIRGVSSAALEL